MTTWGRHDVLDRTPLQRRLYWSGLLRPSADQRRLVWRCPAIREAGRTILSEPKRSGPLTSIVATIFELLSTRPLSPRSREAAAEMPTP